VERRHHRAAHNPLNKVPVLVLDDGTHPLRLDASSSSTSSLGRAAFIPQTGRERIARPPLGGAGRRRHRRRLAIFLERKRPANLQERHVDRPPALEDRRGLAEIDVRELGGKPWFGGNTFTLADIAVGCALGYLEFRMPEIAWRRDANRRALALIERLSFAETVLPRQ
jgi:glutathione S-transferase